MAFRKTKMNEIFGTVLVLSALLSTASAVDCFGKSFHCVNATHFMICVDLGGGVSQSIDDFLIPCPPPTVCQGNNHFECEFPAVTTPPTTLSNVISETTEPWEEIVVTTNSPPKNSSTTKEYSEKYMNTVSLTTVAEDNLTTDTTVDIVTTEASALNNVNNNSNISEIVPISPIYEATIEFDGITQTMPNKILISAAEITTDMPQIPLYQIRNVTNETTINNVTLISSVTEPTGIMNNNYTNESNDLVGDVRNITVTSQADNVTNINIFDDVVTPDMLLIDPSNGTERPSKTITDESLLTDDNQVVTTDTQSLVSTDGLQNSGNLNILTTTIEPAIIQNTIEPVFEENLTTYSVQDFATEQLTVLTPEVVQSTQTELPITTYQSTVTTITSINVKDELTVETTIGLDQITTTIYEEDFSTADHDIYTTEAPLSIATNGKQDTQNTNVSDKASTKFIDDTIVYMGIDQSTPDINRLSSNIDVTTEQTIAFTTETQKPLVTEQSKTNKDSSATEKIQQPIVKDSLKPSHMGIEQSTPDINGLSSNIDVTTEQTIAFTTETQKLLVTEQSKTNKDSSATEKIQQPIVKDSLKPSHMGIEQSTPDINGLSSNIDVTTEQTIAFTTETQKLLVTEHSKTNKDSSATEKIQQPIVKDSLKPSHMGIEQSTPDINRLSSNIDVTTEQTIAFTTETKLLVTEQSKINKNSSATEKIQQPIAKDSLKPSQKRLNTDQAAITENPSDLATEAQRQLGTENITVNKYITTIGNDEATEASALPMEAQKPIYKSVEQSDDSTISLATNSDIITENPVELITEKSKQEETGQLLTTNKNISASGNEVIAETSILSTEEPKPIHNEDEQQKTGTKILPTENISIFTTVTQKTNYIGTEQPTTIKSHLLIDSDVTTDKVSVYATDTQESTKQIIEVEKPFFLGTDKTTTNTNKLAINNDGTVEKVSDFIKEVQKPIYKSTEHPITSKQNLATDKDTIAEKTRVFGMETEKPIDMSNQQSTTNKSSLETDMDVNAGKASIFTTEPTLMSTVQLTTINNDLATDIEVSPETAIGSATGTSKSAIKIQKEIEFGVSDHNIATEQQKQESLSTDTTVKTTTEKNIILFGAITTDNIMQSAGVTEQPITTAFGDNIVIDTTTSNIEPTATKIVQSINTTTITEATTLTIPEDKIKEEITGFTSNAKANVSDKVNELPVDNVQTVNNIINEQPNQNSFEFTTGTVDSLISTTVKSVYITKDDRLSSTESTLNLRNGQQKITLSTQIDKSDLANEVTTDASPDIANDINTPIIDGDTSINNDTKVDTTSALEINEVNYSNQKTVKSTTQDIPSVVENVDNNQHTTESNLKAIGTAVTTRETTSYDNMEGSDTDISNAAVNEHIIETDTVNSEIYATERANLIPAENVGAHVVKELPLTETVELQSISTLNLNQVNDSLDSRLQVDSYNQSKKSNSAYSGQLSGAEVTSETTATDNVTPSLNPNNESSQKDKHFTSNNQVNTENTEIVIDNLADQTSSFATASNTIFNEKDNDLNIVLTENGNIYNTLPSLNTQENTYVSFTTEKSSSSFYNEANNQVPELTAISENVTKETLQLSTQTNDLKHSLVTSANNDVNDFTTITGVIENTETTFTEKSTTIDGIDFELPITNKNEIVQEAETTTQPFDNVEPMKTFSPIKNENVNNLLSTQDNSYVSFTTEKEAISPFNELKNHAPKSTAISENVTQVTLQLSTQTNNLKPSHVTSANNDVDNFTTNKNEIIQRVKTTTRPFDNGEPMQTIAPIENDNVNKILSTQDNSYVSFTTEKEASSLYNEVKNHVPKLTAISENATQETLLLSHAVTQTNDLKPSPETRGKNDVDDFTTITGVIENTGSSFTEKSTTIDGIDFELHITNKNEIVQRDETTTQPFDNGEPMQTISPIKNENVTNLLFNPLSNILLDKQNQAVKPATEGTMYFSTKNDETVNSMDILSTGTFPITDVSSAQLSQVKNTNDVTNQASIPLVKMNDNLPSSRLNSLPVTHDLQKTWQADSMAKTEKPSFIQTKTISLKESSAPKEELVSNSGDVVTSYAIPTTDSTAEFSIIEGVQNVYKTIESYFSTPSETSTPGTFNKKGNGDITPIRSSYDIQDKTKTSSSAYSTKSSLIENNENFDSLITKLGPIDLLPPVTYSGDYSKMEMSTESSKNGGGGGGGDNTIFNKPVISEALPVPNYEINTDKPNKNTTQANKTSETKVFKEPLSATSNPRKYVTSTINNYQYVTVKSDSNTASESSGSTGNVDIPSEVSQQNVNALKTDAKSLPGQSNDQNNSSFYSDKASSGSKSTLVAQSTYSNSKSQTDSAITTSQVPEKVSLETNTVNTETNGNTLQNNSSIEPRIIYLGKNSTITVTASKDVLKDIIKNGSALLQNSTNTTKFNTQGDLKSQQKTTMYPTEHDAGQVRPTTSKQDITHPVTTISQVSSTKITPTPVAPTTTTENVSKKIPKTAPVNYNCINGLRSRYSDKNDCRKFYICLGNSQPIIGNCPANTVFSDISKMCTKNLSHCIRENEFKCPSTGRFSDVLKDNVYYICVSHKNHLFRFKFLCQKGFTLNKATIRCIENREIESNESVSISLSENSSDRTISSKTSSSSSSTSSSSNSGSSTSMSTSSDSSSSSDSSNSKDNNGSSVSTTSKSKEKEESTEKPEGKEGDEEDEVFECEKEGKFPVRNDCRRYYLCKKNRKSEYRRKIKKCESGDVFHKGKKNSNNSRESSNSENNSDRHPSKRRQRKEKKEEPESSHSEDNSDRYPSKRRQRKEKKEESESSDSENNSDRHPSKRRQRKEKKEEPESSHSEDNSDRYPSKRRQRKEKKEESESSDSENNSDRHHSKRRQRKEKKEEPENEEDDEKEVFECEREGKFPVPGDCRRYYLCKKNRKSEYRRKIRKCDSDEVFHKSKKKCVDADSYEC